MVHTTNFIQGIVYVVFQQKKRKGKKNPTPEDTCLCYEERGE